MTAHESSSGPDRCLICHQAATVIVRDGVGIEAPMCPAHWREALTRSGGLIRAVRLVEPSPPTP